MIKHFNIYINGKVQGVYFRASAQKKANEFGLSGIIKNEPGGSVYIEVEGEEEKISPFIDWCRKGPERAFVTGLDVHEGVVKNYEDFRIIR